MFLPIWRNRIGCCGVSWVGDAFAGPVSSLLWLGHSQAVREGATTVAIADTTG